MEVILIRDNDLKNDKYYWIKETTAREPFIARYCILTNQFYATGRADGIALYRIHILEECTLTKGVAIRNINEPSDAERPNERAAELGTQIDEILKLTKIPRSTLSKWFDYRRVLFDVICVGVCMTRRSKDPVYEFSEVKKFGIEKICRRS